MPLSREQHQQTQINNNPIITAPPTNQPINQQPEKLNVYKNDTDSSWDYTLGKDLRFFLS